MKLIDADEFERNLKRNFCEDCNSYNGVRCRACQIGDVLLELYDTIDVGVPFDKKCDYCKYNNLKLCGIDNCEDCEKKQLCEKIIDKWNEIGMN